MMKAKHQLGMENQRLRAMMHEITEIASVVLNRDGVSPQEEVSELTSSEPEVYELLG
jgi:hypothetical protein